MSDMTTNSNGIDAATAREIRSEIKSLNIQLSQKKEKKTKIEAARDKISELSSGELSKAKTSFEWTSSKMDEYWYTTESSVRDKVQTSLNNVAKEFGDEGTIMSELPGLLAKTAEKLEELNNEIAQIERELEVLESKLSASAY